MRIQLVTVPFLVVVMAGAGWGQTQFLNPGTPYLSGNDSPFAGFFGLDTFFLEDFEDGLNSLGVTPTTGGNALDSNAQVDSVDGDDGSIDGSGALGGSFFTFGNTQILTFVFDEAGLGGLPTHAGVVWTDVGQKVSGVDFGLGDVLFEAFDPQGQSLGTETLVGAGDGSTFAETDEDRFLGVTHAGGISRVEISMADSNDWEMDHLQYGRVPEPATLAVMGVGVLLLRRRRPAVVSPGLGVNEQD